MLILLKNTATEGQVDTICQRVEDAGLTPGLVPGARRTAITVTGNVGVAVVPDVEELPGVLRVIHVTKPYRLTTLEGTEGQASCVRIGAAGVGSANAWFVAGPCSVDDPERLIRIARQLASMGAQALRGGAFKPRTNPYAFQGHGEEGLQWLAAAREETGLPIVTEAMDVVQVEAVERYADVIQIGARNMQNFALLREVGRAGMPVLLKRHWAATLEEWLGAAEYIAAEGNLQIVLCERGIRSFTQGSYSRFTLDLNVLPAVRRETFLPVIVDPSHATGDAAMVPPAARAALAAGADGLMIEVLRDGADPSAALCDGLQSVTPEVLRELLRDVRPTEACSTEGPPEPAAPTEEHR